MTRDPLQDRSPLLLWLFGWYLCWRFHRNFDAVRVSLTGLPDLLSGRRVIIYSNHPSWWDPALYIIVGSRLLPHRVGFGPMDEFALRRYGLLRSMGVFGIDPRSVRGAADFLSISRRALAAPDRTLWVTAEGAFTDARRRPVILQPGIAHLARQVPDVVLLPLAIEYVFWNESRPEALVRFGSAIEGGREHSVAEWTALLADALTRNMDILAKESMTRDPTLFRPVLHGATGIGGIYDLWRRGRAWASGRRFNASHARAASRVGEP